MWEGLATWGSRGGVGGVGVEFGVGRGVGCGFDCGIEVVIVLEIWVGGRESARR